VGGALLRHPLFYFERLWNVFFALKLFFLKRKINFGPLFEK